MKKNSSNKGFSMLELVVVIAIMAVLTGIMAPIYISKVEIGRESVDLENVRAAYEELNASITNEDNEYYDAAKDRKQIVVALTQSSDGWQTSSSALSIAGITSSSSNWHNAPKKNGNCIVYYDSANNEIILDWEGKE